MCLDGIAAIRFLFRGNFKHFWAVTKAHAEFYSHIGRNKAKRKAFTSKIKISAETSMTGMMQEGIVKGYFLKKKKVFTDYVK